MISIEELNTNTEDIFGCRTLPVRLKRVYIGDNKKTPNRKQYGLLLGN